MSLELFYHPFASYCWKALIALYENGTPFEPHLVDLGDPAASAAFKQVWPIGKFPVLRDRARGQTVPEASVIIEYLAVNYPGPCKLIPTDADLAWQMRVWDRFYDLYVHTPMQKVVGDALRPPGKQDEHGVEEAKAQLRTSYGIIEQRMAAQAWGLGSAFSMVDCAAAPALHYADFIVPLSGYEHVAGYLRRLKERPSFARVLAEAAPYWPLFPLKR